MTLSEQLQADVPGIVAILRGVKPDEVVEIGHALIEAGIRIIEVPLNSPEPLVSIERLASSTGPEVLVGAGTVLSPRQVRDVRAAGGRVIVAPNTDARVIECALALELDILPGVMTPTEAFAALAAGARQLKLFPAGTAGSEHLRAMREVLPPTCGLWAVGGVSAANLQQWISAGAAGVGVGGSLYRAGTAVDTVRAHARGLVSAWRAGASIQARSDLGRS